MSKKKEFTDIWVEYNGMEATLSTVYWLDFRTMKYRWVSMVGDENEEFFHKYHTNCIKAWWYHYVSSRWRW